MEIFHVQDHFVTCLWAAGWLPGGIACRRAVISDLQIFNLTASLSLTTGSLPQSRQAIRIINQAAFSSSKKQGLPKQLFPDTNLANLPPGCIPWEKLGNRLGQRSICTFPWLGPIPGDQEAMHVCEQLHLQSGRRIFIYCWKCSCTQKTFWGFYFLLQAEEIRGRNSSQDTAHKNLGLIFWKNSIAEEKFCLPGSLGQVH